MLAKFTYYVMVLVSLALLWAGYMLIRPYTLFDQKSLVVTTKVVTKDTKSIFIHSDTCVHYAKPAVLEIYLAQAGGATKILKVDLPLAAGCHVSDQPFPVSLIPEYAKNGDYFLRFDISSKVNPLRTITQTANSTPFKLER